MAKQNPGILIPYIERGKNFFIFTQLLFVFFSSFYLLTHKNIVYASTPTYAVTQLKAVVNGTSVTATTTINASTTITAQYAGICSRTASGVNVDFPKQSNIQIKTTGTTITALETFASGTYSYFACLEVNNTWYSPGSTQYFTIGSATPTPKVAPTATTKPTPLPTTTPTPLPIATPTPNPTYTISGTVYIDTNQNGVQDNGESGYSGATVSLVPIPLTTDQTATTSALGAYSFSNITPGSYLVTITLPNGYTETTTNPVSLSLNSNTTVNFGIITTSTITPTPTPTTTPADISSQWDVNLANTVYADVTESVPLPNGNTLWIFGDTTQVNGVSTVGAFGYPHDSFVTQAPGTMNFTPIQGNYGYGWQQVPNWADGTYFWMATPIVDNGVLYVIGERIQGTNPIGEYVARFNANTLTFEDIYPVPMGSTGTTQWGDVAKGPSGWYITGIHIVPCTGVTDCESGDLAYVPFGQLTNNSSWTITNNFVPASDNIADLALVQTETGWDIFTKLGGPYGSNQIEQLTASSVYGPWAINNTWNAPYPSGTVTYGVAVHPEQVSPTGQILVSYNVNGVSVDYHALFLYLPK